MDSAFFVHVAIASPSLPGAEALAGNDASRLSVQPPSSCPLPSPPGGGRAQGGVGAFSPIKRCPPGKAWPWAPRRFPPWFRRHYACPHGTAIYRPCPAGSRACRPEEQIVHQGGLRWIPCSSSTSPLHRRRYRGPGPWPVIKRRGCWFNRLHRAPSPPPRKVRGRKAGWEHLARSRFSRPGERGPGRLVGCPPGFECTTRAHTNGYLSPLSRGVPCVSPRRTNRPSGRPEVGSAFFVWPSS